MRRAVLTVTLAAGLAIGTAIPTAAIGETQDTLSCDDGTSTTLSVNADTLTGLTQAIQAMIDYPAGLTCTLVKVPGLASFGAIALASPGQSPFIVGGGRWQASCDSVGLGGGGGGVGGAPVAGISQFVWVNIAVNIHQHDDGTFFGTLNETIPANQACPGGTTRESHFTSKPELGGCLKIDLADPTKAYVRSHVTQTSGAPFPLAAQDADITFTFRDNGSPSRANDQLQGPPELDASSCDLGTGDDPGAELLNGNISIHD